MKNTGIIYKVTNIINSKVYIGQTIKTLHIRKTKHIQDAINRDPKFIFHRAIRKYSTNNFKWEIVWTGDRTHLSKMEKYFIICCKSHFKYSQGYNMTSGGEGLNHGKNHPNYNNTKYEFYHKSGNSEFKITPYDLSIKYNLNSNHVREVISGKLLATEGWGINPINAKIAKASQKEKYTFKHDSGINEEDVTRTYMCKKYNLSRTNLYHICTYKVKKAKGWCII